MKLTKTQWIIAAIVATVIVWYFFLRKKDIKKESGYVIRNKPTIKPTVSGGGGVSKNILVGLPGKDGICPGKGSFKCMWQRTTVNEGIYGEVPGPTVWAYNHNGPWCCKTE